MLQNLENSVLYNKFGDVYKFLLVLEVENGNHFIRQMKQKYWLVLGAEGTTQYAQLGCAITFWLVGAWL